MLKSKCQSLFFILVLISSVLAYSQTFSEDFTILNGPYLGQEPPEMSPEMLAPGILSTGFYDVSIAFTPDGKECFWDISIDGFSSILTSRMENGTWIPPEVASFSGIYRDGFPTMISDGSRLFFHSNRPIDPEDSYSEKYNIWYINRENGGWSEPVSIGSPVNSEEYSALCPSVAGSGNIYFSRQTKEEEMIYLTRYVDGRYTEPEPLPEIINTKKYQFHACIAPDESYLVIPLWGRDDSVNEGANCYVSFRNENDKWSELINLGKVVNNGNNLGVQSITADGKYFIFNANSQKQSPRFLEKQISYLGLQKMAIINPARRRGNFFWISSKIITDLRSKAVFK